MPLYSTLCADPDHDSRAGQPGHGDPSARIERPEGAPEPTDEERRASGYLCLACARARLVPPEE